MNKEKIEELKKKRALLKNNIRLMMLQQRISNELSFLNSNKEPYKLYYEFENLHWIDNHVKIRNRDGYQGIHGDFQIDVNDLDALESLEIKENVLSSPQFRQHFSFTSNRDKVIICRQGGDPEIEVSLDAFLSNPILFCRTPETWVLDKNKNWILEYIWDQEMIRIIHLDNGIPRLTKKLKIIYA